MLKWERWSAEGQRVKGIDHSGPSGLEQHWQQAGCRLNFYWQRQLCNSQAHMPTLCSCLLTAFLRSDLERDGRTFAAWCRFCCLSMSWSCSSRKLAVIAATGIQPACDVKMEMFRCLTQGISQSDTSHS